MAIINFDDYVERIEESKIKPTDYISLFVSLAAGGTAYKLFNKDMKERCEWYGIKYGFGAKIISLVIAKEISNMAYRASDTTINAVMAAVNTILKGDEDGRGKTGGYQTEQSQVEGNDDSED